MRKTRTTSAASTVTTIHDLTDSALLLVFRHASTLCSPGTCLAAQVCRRWRDVAAGATGLRVIFADHGDSKSLSFASLVARHAQCLEGLALDVGSKTCWPLDALQAAAAKAVSAGQQLPLTTLLVTSPCNAHGLSLLYSLPNLQQLHLFPAVACDLEDAAAAAAAAVRLTLAPLQQASQLTKLTLEGPAFLAELDEASANEEQAAAALQAASHGMAREVQQLLPHSLQDLRWDIVGGTHSRASPVHCLLVDAGLINLNHLTGLARLCLSEFDSGTLQPEAFTAVQQLTCLRLFNTGGRASEVQQLRRCLQTWQPLEAPQAVDSAAVQQLVNLTTLALPAGTSAEVWRAAVTALTRLREVDLVLPADVEVEDDGSLGVDLQDFSKVVQLRELSLTAPWEHSLLQITKLQPLTHLGLFSEGDDASQQTIEIRQLALRYLTNLVSLTLNAPLVASRHHWLIHLPCLVLLDMHGGLDTAQEGHLAAHLGEVRGRRCVLAADDCSLDHPASFRARMAAAAPNWEVLLGRTANLFWRYGGVCTPSEVLQQFPTLSPFWESQGTLP